MSAEERSDLSAMLSEVRAGCPDAKDRPIRAIYTELLETARRLMQGERRNHTLEAGALVHIETDWRFARAWARGQLGGSEA
jgi:hypothetical protein